MGIEQPGHEQDATFTNPAEGDAVNVGDDGLQMSANLAELVAAGGSEGPPGDSSRLQEVYGANPNIILSTGMREQLEHESDGVDAARGDLESAYSLEAPEVPLTLKETDAKIRDRISTAEARAAEAAADKAETDAMEAQFPVAENLAPAESTVAGAIAAENGEPPEAPSEVPKEYLSSSPVQVATPNVNPSMREARAQAAEAAAKAAKAERKANSDARNAEKRANRQKAQAERGEEARKIWKDEGREDQIAPAIEEAMTSREKAMKHVKNRVGRAAGKLASGGRQLFGNFVDRFRDGTDEDDQAHIDAMNKYSDLVNEHGSGAGNFDIRAGEGADSFVASVKEVSVADGEGGLSPRILFKTEPADVEVPTIKQQKRYLIADNGDVTVEAPDPNADGEMRSQVLKPGDSEYGEIMSQLNAAIDAKTAAEKKARAISANPGLAA
ncbi:hypothetical protein KBC31_01485 [Candidatus Saccharibacteria bacterium]|nr:hypothetical protein [Candidatus Saccharibacteria bacterium]